MKIALCFYGKFTGKNNRGEIQGFDVPFDYLKKNVITEKKTKRVLFLNT